MPTSLLTTYFIAYNKYTSYLYDTLYFMLVPTMGTYIVHNNITVLRY